MKQKWLWILIWKDQGMLEQLHSSLSGPSPVFHLQLVCWKTNFHTQELKLAIWCKACHVAWVSWLNFPFSTMLEHWFAIVAIYLHYIIIHRPHYARFYATPYANMVSELTQTPPCLTGNIPIMFPSPIPCSIVGFSWWSTPSNNDQTHIQQNYHPGRQLKG